jgi:uncharacterized paraquat-inducible protein A
MTIHRNMWREFNKEPDSGKAKKYVCAHCRTGMIVRLPAICPECNRYLNEEVKRNKRKKE